MIGGREYERRLKIVLRAQAEKSRRLAHGQRERIRRSMLTIKDVGDGLDRALVDGINGLIEKHIALGGRLPLHKLAPMVLLRDGFICHYCGEYSLAPEVDHKIPQSRGGSDEINNLVCACRRCYLEKGTKTVSEFMSAREWIAAQVRNGRPDEP